MLVFVTKVFRGPLQIMLKKMVKRVLARTLLLHTVEDRERFREVVAFSDLTTLIFMQLHDHAEELILEDSYKTCPGSATGHAHSIESLQEKDRSTKVTYRPLFCSRHQLELPEHEECRWYPCSI